MKKSQSRRDFINTGCMMCAGCAALFSSSRLYANDEKNQEIDLDSYTYCAYQCPDDCPLFIATQKNDVELKKECYKNWKWKEKFGMDFDPELVFCWKCKNEEKPKSMLVEKCPVRLCALEKGYKTCIQCKTLKDCDQKLWSDFPKHKEAVLALQEKYKANAEKK